jgi:hypothetical protein
LEIELNARTGLVLSRELKESIAGR